MKWKPPRHWLLTSAAVCMVWALGKAGRADAPPGRYRTPSEGTVYDTETTLTWQQADDGELRTWDEADAYCQELPLDGGGWRLPTVKDALTIVDDSRYSPALDPTAFFTSAEDMTYWVGTPQAGFIASNYYWVVHYFSYGDLSLAENTHEHLVRCVR